MTAEDPYRARYGPGTPADLPDLWSGLVAAQLAHRSVRAYLPDPVSDATLTTLIAAAQSAPSSSNLQLWSVVAVRDPRRRSKLAEIAGGQRHIEEAPLLLVWLADLACARRIAAEAGASGEGADYLESALLAVIDAALAAQNAALAAESLGLGTVFAGALRNDPLAVSGELGLPPHVFPVFGLVVGHPNPARATEVKPRLAQPVVLHHERYDDSAQADGIRDYEKLLADFYAEAGLEPSWVRRVAERFGSVAGLRGRDRLREAFRRQGFRLR